ncbi:MAG: hypothetical protein RMY36_024360 [Nostoc sp. SerVER01]|nr:hypothetical protein [Nostoc sp. SerVER01]
MIGLQKVGSYYLATAYYDKSIGIVYDNFSYAPSMGMLLADIGYRQNSQGNRRV